MARSAAFWGWDHEFIIKRDQPENNYYIWKPTWRAEQLGWMEAVRAWDKDFLLYIDGWDAVFTGPPQELVPHLRAGKMSFCGDTVLFPETMPWREMAPLFPEVRLEQYRYVNAGVVWGDRKLFEQYATEYLLLPESLVNQQYFNWRYLYERGLGGDRLSIDSRAEVALNIMLTQKRFFEVQANRVRFVPTGTSPIILHACGQGETFKESMVPMPAEVDGWYREL